MFFPSPSKSPQKNKNKYHQRLSKPNSFNLEGNKLKRDRNYSNIETSHRYENKNYIDEWIENYEEKESLGTYHIYCHYYCYALESIFSVGKY